MPVKTYNSREDIHRDTIESFTEWMWTHPVYFEETFNIPLTGENIKRAFREATDIKGSLMIDKRHLNKKPRKGRTTKGEKPYANPKKREKRS